MSVPKPATVTVPLTELKVSDPFSARISCVVEVDRTFIQNETVWILETVFATVTVSSVPLNNKHLPDMHKSSVLISGAAAPNAASLAGYEKQCSFYRKRGLDLFLWVLPLGLSPVVSRYGGKPFNALYPDVLDRTLTLPLRIINAFVSRHCEKVPLAFGENFDSLDAQLRERHSFMLPRNAVELKSRLMENPDSNRYGVLVRRDRDAELQGVLIYKDTFQDGLRILFVADTFAIDHSSLTHLWNAALEMAFRLRYDLIAVWAQRSWSSIASMLPVPPVPVVRKEVIIYDYGRGREALNDCGSWRFSILDSDNI